MLERTQVFVDTSYLLASFFNSWETGARSQLVIDLPEVVALLGGMIQQQLNQPIQRQMWYDGIPEAGPHRYQRALRTCDGVQLRSGQLADLGGRRTQKAVDTRLVADMVVSSLRGQCSDMVLVSGDADMLPGVHEATAAGVRVHLYGFGWDSMSSALRHACDSTTVLDPREDFGDCMQLRVLEGPLPPVIKGKPITDAEPPEKSGPTLIPAIGSRPPRPRHFHPDNDPGIDRHELVPPTTRVHPGADHHGEISGAAADHPQAPTDTGVHGQDVHSSDGQSSVATPTSSAKVHDGVVTLGATDDEAQAASEAAADAAAEISAEAAADAAVDTAVAAAAAADAADAATQPSRPAHSAAPEVTNEHVGVPSPSIAEPGTTIDAGRHEAPITPDAPADSQHTAATPPAVSPTPPVDRHDTHATPEPATRSAVEPDAPSTMRDHAGGTPTTAEATQVGRHAAHEAHDAQDAATRSSQRTDTAPVVQPTPEPQGPATIEATTPASTPPEASPPPVSRTTTPPPTSGQAPKAAKSSVPKPSVPKPSMMAPRRRLTSQYIPVASEVWASAGQQRPFDVGQQYAIFWYDRVATEDERDSAHELSGGSLPPNVDRPLLQFACEALSLHTLEQDDRVALRDGFHQGIRGVLLNRPRSQ